MNLINAATGAAAALTVSATPTALNFSAPLQSTFISGAANVSAIAQTGTGTAPTTNTVQLTDVTGLGVGMMVRGPGVLNSTTITAINTGTNTITLSSNVNTAANTASVAAAERQLRVLPAVDVLGGLHRHHLR